MGRGAQTQTMQMTDQQLANQNAMNQALYNQGQSLSSTTAGGYQSLLANPGYTPAQQSAITNQSMGALSSAFGALAQSAANRLARMRFGRNWSAPLSNRSPPGTPGHCAMSRRSTKNTLRLLLRRDGPIPRFRVPRISREFAGPLAWLL